MKKAYLPFLSLLLSGFFLISIGLTEAFAQPANDDCANAIMLNIGDTDTGSTVGATDNNPPTCNFAGDGLGGGVWYSVMGNGGSIIASLCGSFYDTQIAVYTGSCGALNCVTGNDDFCGLQSQVSWASTAGTTYYIYIDGFSFGTGTYTISLPAPPTNDDCSNAIALSVGDTDTGSTTAASDSNPPFCGGAGDGTGGGVWYTVTGTALDITASLCGSSYDTQIAVYTGSCGALSCVTGNDDFCGLQSQVTWASIAGETYYIYIDGFFSSTGNYTLSIDGLLPPPIDNDDCSTANTISCGDTAFGSTLGAFPDNVRRCGPGTAGGGVWYTFNPNDGGFIQSLSTCGANFDTKITIYYGDCNRLRCLGSLDDSEGCPNGSTEMFFTPFFGRTHYVLVQPSNPAQPGVFDLAYDCDASVARTAGATVIAADVAENFETVKLYPNPAQDVLNVELTDFAGDRVMLNVLNSLGQVVMQRAINQVEEQVERLNTSNLQSGIYYLNVQVEGKETFTKKFMVGGVRP